VGKRLVLLVGLALVVAGSTATAIREASTVEEPGRLATMLEVAKQRAREAGVEPDRAIMARFGPANGP
jgi:hypothetical protein